MLVRARRAHTARVRCVRHRVTPQQAPFAASGALRIRVFIGGYARQTAGGAACVRAVLALHALRARPPVRIVMRAARTLGALQRMVLPVAVEAADAARFANFDHSKERKLRDLLSACGAAAVRFRAIGLRSLSNVVVAVHASTFAGPASSTSVAILARVPARSREFAPGAFIAVSFLGRILVFAAVTLVAHVLVYLVLVLACRARPTDSAIVREPPAPTHASGAS